MAGALLVAPADVDRGDARPELHGFAPTPQTAIPFPSIVVASQDDPWIAPDRARSLAAAWGSHFVDAGTAGHLNAASGIGHWPEGQDLLDRVVGAATDGFGHSRPPGDAHATLTHAAHGPWRSQHATR